MSDINIKDIRVTANQRTWIAAYLQIAAPHDPRDPFCRLLVELLGQPMLDEPLSGPALHLVEKPTPKVP